MTVKEIAVLLLKMESEADRKLALELIKGLSPTEVVQWPPYQPQYPYTITRTWGATGTGNVGNGDTVRSKKDGGNIYLSMSDVSGSEVPKPKEG